MNPPATSQEGVDGPDYTAGTELTAQLTGFWAADVWDMADCPLLPKDRPLGHVTLHFDCLVPALNGELKYACLRKLTEGHWTLRGVCPSLARVRTVIQFLKATAPEATSLLERDLDSWLATLHVYLHENVAWGDRETTCLDQFQQPHTYVQPDPCISTLRQLYQVVQAARDPRAEYAKDIWDVRKMGARLSPADLSYQLNFAPLVQPWLRQVAKQYLRYCLPLQALGTCRWILNALRHFSCFLAQFPRPVQAADIDRALIVDYLAYLATAALSVRSRQNCLVHLRGFLEISVREGWGDFPERRVIYDEDMPTPPARSPRPIPEEVLTQLEQHLAALPELYCTMVITLRECGMRISELCALPLDCLFQDQEGDWFLRYPQWKMNREHSIPITSDLATLLQQQQQRIRATWGDQCGLLFPNAKGQRLTKSVIGRALNRLAYEKDIRDATGKVFRFRTHEFRHTVATRMIRNGVALHHVQRYLGHESPEMTLVYAEITDHDLKRAFDEYQQFAVNVTGQKMPADHAVTTDDLQWFKKNIMAQALPNGFCALPALAAPCPFPNACLTCANFRTNVSFLEVLRCELAATEALLDKARANRWARQLEMNEQVRSNLQRIIASLEETTHESSTECGGVAGKCPQAS